MCALLNLFFQVGAKRDKSYMCVHYRILIKELGKEINLTCVCIIEFIKKLGEKRSNASMSRILLQFCKTFGVKSFRYCHYVRNVVKDTIT